MGVVLRLSTHHTPYVTLNIKRQQQELSNIITQLYHSFEESSLINIVENYNHCLAEIGSHVSSLTLGQIPTIFGSENVRSDCRWFKFTQTKNFRPYHNDIISVSYLKS